MWRVKAPVCPSTMVITGPSVWPSKSCRVALSRAARIAHLWACAGRSKEVWFLREGAEFAGGMERLIRKLAGQTPQPRERRATLAENVRGASGALGQGGSWCGGSHSYLRQHSHFQQHAGRGLTNSR